METNMTLIETEFDREARVRAARIPRADVYAGGDPSPAHRATTLNNVQSVSGALVEAKDVAAVAVGSIMMLGPLLAYAVGLGL